MLGEVPSVLVDAGTVAGIVVALIAAVAAFSKTRPVRFLWRTLVSKPIGEWQVRQIKNAVAPIEKKLDLTAVALVDHMADEIKLRGEDAVRWDEAEKRDRADRVMRQRDLDKWRDEVRNDVRGVHKRLDRTLEAVIAGNPEIRPEIAYDLQESEEEASEDGNTVL